MTTEKSDYGFPPPPVTELTMEQEFKLKRLELLLQEASKDDIITVFLSLQHQNFVLGNTVSNLIHKWPISNHPTDPDTINEVLLKFGTLFEIKD